MVAHMELKNTNGMIAIPGKKVTAIYNDEPTAEELRDIEENIEEFLEDNSDEVALNSTVKSMLAKVSGKPLLTREEEQELFRRYRKGEVTKDEVMNNYIRLIYKLALRYSDIFNTYTVDDIFQEGCIGCLIAMEKYDPESGFRFLTYAFHWIRQNILRALRNKDKSIRFPVHIEERGSEFIRYLKENDLMDISANRKLEIFKKWCRENNYNYTNLIEYFRMSVTSLDKVILEGDHNETHTLGEIIPDDTNVEDEATDSVLVDELDEIMKKNFTPIERDVIRKRHGLDGSYPMTLAEIGGEKNLSRERIRQIESRALKKLRMYVKRSRLIETIPMKHGLG